MKELLYQGSVKNLFMVNSDILFEYSDRYSLFDWGEMPDQIEKKGECLALMGALFFKELTKQNIIHHFLHMSDDEGNEVALKPTRYLKVKNVPVKRPAFIHGQYDYSYYQVRPQQGLVPLEVMFRFGLGKGSSLTKRLKEKPELKEQWPGVNLTEGVLFDDPIIDFSTKLEKGDRYVSHAEAKYIAGLTDIELNTLIQDSIKVARIIKTISQDMGLTLWDGKMEWAFNPGSPRVFMLVDSIGLDELRLEKDGLSLSKEFLREAYRQTPWFKTLSEAKEASLKTGVDFKLLCREQPPRLPNKEKNLAEALYLSYTNSLSYLVTGKFLFSEEFQIKNWPREFV